jgi:nodulation protein E
LEGPAYAVASACASATHAIGQAFNMVRTGAVRAAVAGGAEAGITLGSLKGWEAMRIMAPDTCRPFSKDRLGMVLGEGAAVLVLEPFDEAVRRGAEILGEVVGFGMSADARDLISPDVGGMARAMAAALADAQMAAADVQYVNAHGTGTMANDVAETAALKRVFGEHAHSLAVSSTKSMVGHPLGAAGALELVATLMAVRAGVAPPTIGFREPDPLCDLDVVPNEARDVAMDAAISNSFAFGGLNAVLAVKRV